LDSAAASSPAPTPVRWRRTFAALQHPNYRLWFQGQLVSLFGTWMQATGQGFLAWIFSGVMPLGGLWTRDGRGAVRRAGSGHDQRRGGALSAVAVWVLNPALRRQ
jgi:hypothetical protein